MVVSMGVNWGSEIEPNFAITDFYRKRGDIISPRVECSAAGEVEAGIVPGTGNNAIFASTTLEGKTHVRATVINCIDLIV
jgi:hypothetical protein